MSLNQALHETCDAIDGVMESFGLPGHVTGGNCIGHELHCRWELTGPVSTNRLGRINAADFDTSVADALGIDTRWQSAPNGLLFIVPLPDHARAEADEHIRRTLEHQGRVVGVFR